MAIGCFICNLSYEVKSDVSGLECGHLFHTNCTIKHIIPTQSGCPICQKEGKNVSNKNTPLIFKKLFFFGVREEEIKSKNTFSDDKKPKNEVLITNEREENEIIDFKRKDKRIRLDNEQSNIIPGFNFDSTSHHTGFNTKKVVFLPLSKLTIDHLVINFHYSDFGWLL